MTRDDVGPLMNAMLAQGIPVEIVRCEKGVISAVYSENVTAEQRQQGDAMMADPGSITEDRKAEDTMVSAGSAAMAKAIVANPNLTNDELVNVQISAMKAVKP